MLPADQLPTKLPYNICSLAETVHMSKKLFIKSEHHFGCKTTDGDIAMTYPSAAFIKTLFSVTGDAGIHILL